MRDLEDIKRLNDEAVAKASAKRALAAASGQHNPAKFAVVRKQVLAAASLLCTAFDWESTAEGGDFWQDLVGKLESIAGVPHGTAIVLAIEATRLSEAEKDAA